MCGICGFIGDNNLDLLFKMREALKHRGPDEEGHFVNKEISLAHSRLKIIDLISGQQPMFNEDKSLVIVYNGEVYNFLELRNELEKYGHKFITKCDTEVILHSYEQWGENCLNYFNGMFAFAIYDLKNKKLFLARDRAGKKPIYYYYQNGLFIFASELKAILLHPTVKKKINYSALQEYLFFEYVPAPESIIENCYKLEGGHYLIFQNNKIKKKKYWDYSFNGYNKEIRFNEAKEELLRHLKKAIKYRLISDVPLGIFLSGGIDSSTIITLMSEIIPPENIKSFSISFDEKSFDESSYAEKIAKFIGSEHKEEKLSVKKMYEILPEIFTKIDEPFADPSIIPTYLLSKFTRKYVTVALSGDGGDELFAGYDTFIAHNILKNFTMPEIIVKRILKLANSILPVSDEYMSLDFKIKRTISALYFPALLRNEVWMCSFTKEMQDELFLKKEIEIKDIYQPIHRLNFSNLTFNQKIIYLYLKLYMQNEILTKVDRASMFNSLEVRSPFLDVNVINFINSLPDKFKIKFFKRKYILKEAMKNKLPEEIIKRKKQGFGVPLARWFKAELKELLLDTLSEKNIKEENIFNYQYIRKIIEEHQSNKIDHSKELWTLLSYKLWQQNNL